MTEDHVGVLLLRVPMPPSDNHDVAGNDAAEGAPDGKEAPDARGDDEDIGRSGHSMDRLGRSQMATRVTIRQRRRSCNSMADSLETNKEYEFDLELANDLSRDYDDVDREEEDATGNPRGGRAGAKGAGHGSGPMGGNRDDHPMRRSSSVRSGSAIDARTLNILLQNDGPEEGRDEDEDRGGDPNGPRRYHNIRGGLTSLKDNLSLCVCPP